MRYRIGIPRGLLYYQFFTLWENFFKQLGMEVVTSAKTNKRIVDQGAALVADEACLPVKIFFGHVADLTQHKLDFLFLPRLVSIEKKAYLCPKIMGLPDMLEASKLKIPYLLKPTLNLIRSNNVNPFLMEMGQAFNLPLVKMKKAWKIALEEQKKYELQVIQEAYQHNHLKKEEELTILLLGHQYNIHDDYFSLNLKEKLREYGCQVITPEQVPSYIREKALKNLPKPMFWTYGKELLGSVYYFAEMKGNKGVILLTSFGCGIDSFIGNMAMRYLAKKGIVHLNITLDEHTGEAGLITRVEAFLDMIRWRRVEDEKDYIPSYGTYVGQFERTARISGTDGNSTSPYQ